MSAELSGYVSLRLVGYRMFVWNTVFSFYCAIGRQFGKLLVLIAPTGGEEILKAYLAQTKIIAFGNKRPNVLAKCAADYTHVNTLRSINTGRQIVAA